MQDIWDSALYEDRHSFVWKGSADLVDALAPQPGERILDLGCGTGHLTAQIAQRGTDAIGLDLSPSMIAQARQNFPNLRFILADARDFRPDSPFDAVFSNAALHWIPEPETVIANVARALKPGGGFVLEMGAKGNIARITSALEAVLGSAGGPVRNPWYFPSLAEYAALLEKYDFEVRGASTFERWNRLEHPEKGLREWLEMFAGPWFDGMPPGPRDKACRAIEELLRPALWRDNSWWADYKRLRIMAVYARTLPPATPNTSPVM